MLAHWNSKQNMWLCSKLSTFFPFMHCPLVANRKVQWSIGLQMVKAGSHYAANLLRPATDSCVVNNLNYFQSFTMQPSPLRQSL